MKYKLKTSPVEVKPYTFGMEDGFIEYSEFIEASGQRYPVEYRSIKYPRYYREYEGTINKILSDEDTHWEPYINTQGGVKQRVSPDYLIITDINNKRSACKKTSFYNLYEKVGD